ncbi:MAG: hypothetical protein OXU69_09735 [Gemmatimonadota bacterium]|nr:hypothetical protein [Gemmatimonadota bacterium]MDE2984972.1 hypothetical protein [Gemmatimonadota bacterium]
MRPDPDSLPLLRRLHGRVFGCEEVRAVLAAAFAQLAASLEAQPGARYTMTVIPVDRLLEDPMPAEEDPVRMCRLFLLRRGARMAAPERHRNSVQRLVSWRGAGRIHQGAPGEGPDDLRPREIRSPRGGLSGGSATDRELLACWDVVPAGVWHFPEAGEGRDWATVTFHSAGEDEIVDELREAR